MSGTFPEVMPPAAATGGFATVSGRIVAPLQFTIVPGGSPSGSGAVTAKPATAAGTDVAFEPVMDAAGDPLVVPLNAQGTFQISGDGWFSDLRVAGADFTLIVATSS